MSKMMNRAKITAYIFVFLIFTVYTVGPAAAETRKNLLVSFVKNNQDVNSGGFYDYKSPSGGSPGDPNEISTAAALAILKSFDEKPDDESRVKEWLLDKLDAKISVKNLVGLKYTLEGLYYLDEIKNLAADKTATIRDWLADLKRTADSGNYIGYAIDSDHNETVYATYLAVSSYYYLGSPETDLGDIKSNITAFIIACLDKSVGGFAPYPGGTPSLINTYYALRTLEMLDNVGALGIDKETVKSYINSFYISDPDFPLQYGGYSAVPNATDKAATFIATYCAVLSLRIMYAGERPSDATVDWVKNHQNPVDGGFYENTVPGNELCSSTITSYYAVEILKIYPGLTAFDEEIWAFGVDWILIAILCGIIAVVILIAVYVIRKKNAI